MTLWLVSSDEYVAGTHKCTTQRAWTKGTQRGFVLYDDRGVFCALSGARYVHEAAPLESPQHVSGVGVNWYFAESISVKAGIIIDANAAALLCAAGARVRDFDQALLGYASARNDVDLVKYCLANGCDVHYDDESAYVTACTAEAELVKAELEKVGAVADVAGMINAITAITVPIDAVDGSR